MQCLEKAGNWLANVIERLATKLETQSRIIWTEAARPKF